MTQSLNVTNISYVLKTYFHLPRTVYILVLSTFIHRVGTLLLPFLTLYLTTDRGFSIDFSTLAMGLLGLGAIVGGVVGGYLADVFGRRALIITSAIGTAGILSIFGWLISPSLILIALTVFSVLANLYRPAADALIADVVSPQQRPAAFSLMHTSLNLGLSIGAALGGIIATYDFQYLFMIEVIATLSFSVMIIFLVKEDTLTSRELNKRSPGLIKLVKHVLTDRTFIIWCVSSFCIGLVFMQSMSTLPIYLDQIGFGADDFGFLLAVNGLMIVFFQLPVTSLLSNFRRARAMQWAFFLTALGFGLTGYTPVYWGLVLTVVIWTMGELIAVPFLSAIVTDLAPERFRASYLGIHWTAFFCARMIGAPLGGLVLIHGGGTWLWSSSFVVGCIAVGLLFLIRNKI